MNNMQIASDFPEQSDTSPKISFYFTVSTVYTLVSMIWFAVFNTVKARQSMPEYIERILSCLTLKNAKKEQKDCEIIELSEKKSSPNNSLSCYLENSINFLKI